MTVWRVSQRFRKNERKPMSEINPTYFYTDDILDMTSYGDGAGVGIGVWVEK